MSREQHLYQLLLQLAPDLWEDDQPLWLPTFTDSQLQIDILDRKANKLLVVMGNYWKSAKGDLIPDPEMTMAVYRLTETVETLTYEDAFCKKRAYRDDLILVCPSLQEELNITLERWLAKLAA